MNQNFNIANPANVVSINSLVKMISSAGYLVTVEDFITWRRKLDTIGIDNPLYPAVNQYFKGMSFPNRKGNFLCENTFRFTDKKFKPPKITESSICSWLKWLKEHKYL